MSYSKISVTDGGGQNARSLLRVERSQTPLKSGSGQDRLVSPQGCRDPSGAFAAGFAQQIGDIAFIVMAVVGAVFFTILLVAGNTMAQSVRERTSELGVLKAMGFSNSLVLTLVMLESWLIAILGCFAGLGITWLFALGISAGAIPAFQAMQLKISEALRRS